MTNKNQDKPFQIGDFIVSPLEHTLTQKLSDQTTKEHQLPAKSIEVLCYLVNHYPEMISRDQLIDALWPDKKTVGQKSLTNAIWTLRKILSGDSQYPEMITTIRKSGYKFEVTPIFLETEAKTTKVQKLAVKQPERQSSAKPSNVLTISLVTLICCSLLAVMIWPTENSKTATHHFSINNQQPLNITKEPGREIYAANSPDNRWLAYIWYRLDHTSELRLQDTHNLTSQPVTLLSTKPRLLKPLWHHDSQSIFMVRKDQSNHRCEIIELDISTQQLEVITNCSPEAHVFLSRSADGTQLFYTAQPIDSRAAGRYAITLATQSTPQSQPKRLSCMTACKYKDRDLQFSPNGKLALEVRKYTPHTEDLYLINQKNQHTTRLTNDFEQFRGVRWMNDNIHVILSASVHGKRQGFILNSQTKQKQLIDITGFSYPSISADGKHLYFHDWQQPQFISSLQLNGENASPFPLLQSNYNYSEPHYNDKQQQLVYISNETGFTELWLADKDGNNRQQLTNNRTHKKYPRWSFDGQKIAYIAPQAGADKNLLKVIDVDTGVMNTVKTPFHLHRRPTWHRDNQHIITSIDKLDHHHQHSLQLIALDNEQKPQEIQQDGLHGEMLANGDIIFSKENTGLWYYNAELDISNQLLSQQQLGSPFNWTSNQQRIYFESAGK